MKEHFEFDPRLSIPDLYESLEIAEEQAHEAGRKMPTPAMSAVMAELKRRKKDGLF